jgi:membrane-associated protein
VSNTYVLVFLAVLGTVVVPLPEEAALLAAGYASRLGRADVFGCMAAAWLAVMVGDLFTFFVGRYLLGALLRSPLGRKALPGSLLRWAERFVRRHGWRAIVIGRFLFALRGVVFLAVGASRYPLARFAAIDGVAGGLEVPLVVGTGFFFGELRAKLGARVDLIIAIVLAATLVAPPVVRALHERRMRRRRTKGDRDREP